MPELERVINKYQGIKFCDLAADDQLEYLAAVAQRGSLETLKTLGLDDEFAASDLRDVRDILKGFRVIRKTALTTIIATIGRVAGWIIVLILAGMFFHGENAKKLLQLIGP